MVDVFLEFVPCCVVCMVSTSDIVSFSRMSKSRGEASGTRSLTREDFRANARKGGGLSRIGGSSGWIGHVTVVFLHPDLFPQESGLREIPMVGDCCIARRSPGNCRGIPQDHPCGVIFEATAHSSTHYMFDDPCRMSSAPRYFQTHIIDFALHSPYLCVCVF